MSVQNDQGSPGSRSKQKYSPKPVNRGQAKSAPNTKNKQQKGRVRAGQGDKCVVPAKSRPKKRGIVTDGSSLSMDNVTWSEETYRTSSLVDMMRTHFPLLVKVTQGYMGEYGAELSTGQVNMINIIWGLWAVKGLCRSLFMMTSGIIVYSRLHRPRHFDSHCKHIT